MRERRIAFVLFTVALVTGACSASKHAAAPDPTTTSTVAAGSANTEAALRSAIRTEGLTPERAAQLFSLDVAPLPGVSVAGIAPDDVNFDATDAVSFLYAEWGQLTTTQRDAATRLLAPVRTLRTPTTRASRTTAPAAAALLAARTDLRHADAPAPDYLALAQQADTEEGTEVGVAAIGKFVIDISDDMTKAYAETHFYDPPLKLGQKEFGSWSPYSDGCHITVWEKKWAGTDAESAAAIMAHEVFHCYQQRAAGMDGDGRPKYLGIHDWVGEGEATWVMAQLHPQASVVGAIWSKYAFSPLTKYVDRTYDGVGVFGHEGDVAGGQDALWPLLLGVSNAAVGGHDSDALTTLLTSTTDRFYSSWGSSYFEDQSHVDWHMAGPGTPPAAGPSPTSVTVNAGDAEDIGILGTYQAAQTTIQSSADVLVVTLAAGYGQVHDADHKVDTTLDTTAPLALCLDAKNDCKCPDGSPGASEHTTKATAPISVGMDGGDQQLAAYAAGASLDEYCKKPDQPPPPDGSPPPQPGGGGGGGAPDEPQPRPNANSSGDPHLTTFDGTAYDLQTVGEMTLVKSTTDDFDVQVRTAPVAGSASAAINTAVAMRAGGHRLQIGSENGAIQARVDGKLVIDETTKVGNVALQRLESSFGRGFVVTWPDGTSVRAGPYGIVGVNVIVTPAADRRGRLTGLLGNDDGRPDDFVTAGGKHLGSSPARRVLNTTYTDSWRVTASTSLFTYGPGQSTSTFTDPAFPHKNIDARNAPNHATIEQQCREEGITDRFLLQDCIVDASSIHDHAVLSSYAHAQVVQSVRAALAKGLPPFSGATSTPGSSGTTSTTAAASPTTAAAALRTIVDAGRVNDPQETVPFVFAAHAGDVVWVGKPTCDDGGLEFALVDPSGKTLDQDAVDMGLPGCQTGRFDLAADGNYQLVANADHVRSGSYALPVRFQRRDVVKQANYGQTLAGSIPQIAAHDVYTFDAQVGDVVHIFGPGCDIGSDTAEMTLGFRKADGSPSGGTLDCTPGTQNLIQEAGTYQLVVNFANRGPGRYSFMLQK